MVRKYFTKYISSFLKDYIEDLNEDTVEVGLLNGTLKLENVNLKSDILQKYFSYSIKSIKVDLIYVKCSFMSLLYKPIEISVCGITVELEKRIKFKKEDFLFEKIKYIEEETAKFAKSKSYNSLVIKFFEKATIKFERIKIYIEDEDTKDKYELHVEAINSVSVDKNWNVDVEYDSGDAFFKYFEIENCMVLINNKSVLRPCNLNSRIVVRKTNYSNELPDISTDVTIPKIKLHIDVKDYKKLIDMINFYIMQHRMRINIKENINYIDLYDQNRTVPHLIEKFLDLKVEDMPKEYQLDSKDRIDLYTELYKKYLSNKTSEDEVKLLGRYEENNQPKTILKIRHQVLVEQKLQPKRRFLFWTSRITEEEKNQLLNTLEFDDLDQKITTMQITLHVKKLKLRIDANKKPYVFTYSDFFCKHNSVKKLFQCTLKKLSVMCRNNSIIKSNGAIDVCKIMLVNNKLDVHVCGIVSAKLYELQKLIDKLYKYKITDFRTPNVEFTVDKSQLVFDLTCKEISYMIGDDSFMASINEIHVFGNREHFEARLDKINVGNKEQLITKELNASFTFNQDINTIGIKSEIDTFNFHLEHFYRNSSMIFEDFSNYHLYNKDETKVSTNKYAFEIDVRGAVFGPDHFCIKYSRYRKNEEISYLFFEEITSPGMVIDNLKIDLNNGIEIPNPRLCLDIVKMKNNGLFEMMYNIYTKYKPFFNKKNSEATEYKAIRSFILLSEVKIQINHHEKEYLISVQDLSQTQCNGVIALFGSTEVKIKNIDYGTESIVITDVEALKNYETAFLLADFFELLRIIHVFPLIDSPRTSEYSITIFGILLRDKNITCYQNLEITSKNVAIYFLLDRIKCKFDLCISEDQNKNFIDSQISLVKDVTGVCGTTVLQGRVDSEFYKSIFYNLNVTFDIIGHIVANVFEESYNQSMVDWSCDVNVVIYNHRNQEFLVKVIGSVPVVCALTNIYNRIKFRNEQTYLYECDVEMSSHVVIYESSSKATITYNVFTVKLESVKGYDEDGNVSAFLDNGTVIIYKSIYGMYVNIHINQIFLHSKIHKLLMIRHNFIAPNLSLNVPGVSQNTVVIVNINKIKYKNITIKDLLFNEGELSFLVSEMSEYGEYMHRYTQNNLSNILELLDKLPTTNFLTCDTKVYINFTNTLSGLVVFIKINDIYFAYGEKYEEVKLLVDRFIEDDAYFKENTVFDDNRFTKITVHGSDAFVEVNNQYIIHAKQFKIETENTTNGTLYKGSTTVEVKTFNNFIVEPCVYHFEYLNNDLKIKGSQTLRALISKSFLNEKTELIAHIVNYTNIPCEVLYKNSIVDISKEQTIKSKDNEPFVFNFTLKTRKEAVKICTVPKTTQFVLDGLLYIIDLSIPGKKLKIRLYSNIIFKNYTEHVLNILIGDNNISKENSQDKVIIKPFEDACYCLKKSTPLFCKLLIDKFNDFPDLLYFYDGIDNCEKGVSSVESYSKTRFTFDYENTFIFICADLVVAKKDGHKTFYVLLHPEYFIYNATNQHFNFTIKNNTHKTQKNIEITSVSSNSDDGSIRFAEKENEDTFDSLQNIISLPYSGYGDKVDIVYKNHNNVYQNISINQKDFDDTSIELNVIEKYGICYQQKERSFHQMPYLSSMFEIIIYPYYVIYNELNYEINIGALQVEIGQSMLCLPWKQNKLSFGERYKTKGEINFDGVEIYLMLKIKCKGYDPPDSNEINLHKSIFGRGLLRQNDKKFDPKNNISKFYDLSDNYNYKNIALEMFFGSGKYKNSRIVKIDNANIVVNSTKYDLILFTAETGYQIKSLTKSEIHFGPDETFYLFFNDSFGLEDVTDENKGTIDGVYFRLGDKFLKIKPDLYKTLRETCCYIPINTISSKYICLMRNEPTLLKLKTAIKGKQRIIDITESDTWPIMIKNKTKFIVKVNQQNSQKALYINPLESINFCYEASHKNNKAISFIIGKVNILFSCSDMNKSKENIEINKKEKNNQEIIEIIDINIEKTLDSVSSFDNSKNITISLCVSHFALSFYDRKEIACVHAKNIELLIIKCNDHSENLLKFRLTADGLQIDDQNYSSPLPIVLYPKNKDLYVQNEKVSTKPNFEFIKIHFEISDLNLQSQSWKEDEYFSKKVNLFTFAMQEFFLQIDEKALISFINLFKKDEKQKFILQCNECEKIKCECLLQTAKSNKRIIIGTLHIHPIVFKFSFKKSGKGGGIYNKLLKQLFANVSEYKVSLNAEVLNDVDNPIESIRDIIINHYKSQIFKNFFLVIGSLDLLGNFGSFADTFSIGVKDLFYEPLLGIQEDDPKKFSIGLLKGSTSLVRHTVSGISGIFSKFTKGVSKNIAVATFDKKFQEYNVSTSGEYLLENRTYAPKSYIPCSSSLVPVQRGLYRFVDSISSGVSGFVEQPISGAESGVGGFVKGLGKGAIGLVAKPVVGLVDMAGGVADGIKTGMDGTKLCRIQYPRYSDSKLYDLKEATTHYLFLKFIANTGSKFICGDECNKYHFVLTDSCLYIFSKYNVKAIKLDEVVIIDDTLVYKKHRYKIGRRLSKMLAE